MNRIHMRKVSNILCILKVPKNYSFLSLKKKLIINSIYFHVIPLKKKEWRSHQLKALILLAKSIHFNLVHTTSCWPIERKTT